MKTLKIATLDSLIHFKSLLMAYINQPHLDNEWINIVYPVGSIYMSTAEVNPSLLFGIGTWTQIKDVFLLAAGDVYQVNSVGGESEHALTVEELPAHTHTYKRGKFKSNEQDPATGDSVYGASNKTLDAYEGTTGSSGETKAHNNMPPYLTVYVWKRVS